MVEQVAPCIYRIPVPLPNNPLRELNSYLIQDPVRSILIDTGFRMPECRDALLAGLKELNCPLDSVDILLTHPHSDHSGLAPELVAPGRHIYVSGIDRIWIESSEDIGPIRQRQAARLREAAMPEDIIDNMYANNPAIAYAPLPGCKQYTSLNDGDVLSAGGYELRCIHTPGHTPGHMCLWDEAHQLMFTGDHVLFDITPNITSWVNVEDSLGNYLDSLRAIRDYPVKLALPGHRKTGDFTARIDQLLAHHKVRLDETEAIVRREPGSTAYDIAGKMTWSIRAKNWEEFPVAQKFFAVGECMSHLDYLRKRGIVTCEKDGAVMRYTAV